MRTEKVAITLQREVLDAAERLRARTGESRSALINRALRHLVEADQLQRRILEYQAAYRSCPETAEGIAEASALARESLAHLAPWENE